MPLWGPSNRGGGWLAFGGMSAQVNVRSSTARQVAFEIVHQPRRDPPPCCAVLRRGNQVSSKAELERHRVSERARVLREPKRGVPHGRWASVADRTTRHIFRPECCAKIAPLSKLLRAPNPKPASFSEGTM